MTAICPALFVVAAIAAIPTIIIAYALCRAAGMADRALERMHRNE